MTDRSRQPYEKRAEGAYTFIEDYIDAHGYSPSIAEIAEDLEMGRPGCHTLLRKMERDGLISMVPGTARTVRTITNARMITPGDSM
jgi:SOS-response transcriptional repressor LexA